jgi:hypothetical protein
MYVKNDYYHLLKTIRASASYCFVRGHILGRFGNTTYHEHRKEYTKKWSSMTTH